MPVIDIGSPAINRSDGQPATYTWIEPNNPANDTGTIDTVEMWADTNLSDCEVAIFIDEGGDVFSTRDSETIGAVTSGSRQTFSGLDMDVATGDYIGIYYSAGELDGGTIGDGRWYKEGDFIPASSEAFSFLANSIFSLYGTGETGGETGLGNKSANMAARMLAGKLI